VIVLTSYGPSAPRVGGSAPRPDTCRARCARTAVWSSSRGATRCRAPARGTASACGCIPSGSSIVADQHVVAEHARAADRDHVVYAWHHDLPLIERKPGALRNGAAFADLPDPLKVASSVT
jgi:hypothetical protein